MGFGGVRDERVRVRLGAGRGRRQCGLRGRRGRRWRIGEGVREGW